MPSATAPQELQEIDYLVSFCDLKGFYDYCRDRSPREIASLLDAFYELVGEIVEDAGGQVIKFMGDAALMIFAAGDVDRGVLALIKLREASDAWLEARDVPCRNLVSANYGAVCYGRVGTRSDKRPDVFGMTVNRAAVLPSQGLALTPQVYGRLAPATQQLFRQQSPPSRYVPVQEAPQE